MPYHKKQKGGQITDISKCKVEDIPCQENYECCSNICRKKGFNPFSNPVCANQTRLQVMKDGVTGVATGAISIAKNAASKARSLLPGSQPQFQAETVQPQAPPTQIQAPPTQIQAGDA